MTRRRFIADTWTATEATLTGDQAAHLARVLRAEPGQSYDVVAGGFLHRAEVLRVSSTPGSERVDLRLHEELETETALPLHLLLAIYKFDHLEWAIEKTTELGVARITPILARRTEKHLALASEKRVARWRRIALESAKQSRRVSIPDIANPTPLHTALAAEHSPHRILLSETEQATTLPDAFTSANKAGVPHSSRRDGWDVTSSPATVAYALAIGPEGGWAPDEICLFTEHAWLPVTLGPRILRAETAAIAATAILAAHIEREDERVP